MRQFRQGLIRSGDDVFVRTHFVPSHQRKLPIPRHSISPNLNRDITGTGRLRTDLLQHYRVRPAVGHIQSAAIEVTLSGADDSERDSNSSSASGGIPNNSAGTVECDQHARARATVAGLRDDWLRNEAPLRMTAN